MDEDQSKVGKPGKKKKVFTKEPDLAEISVLVETKGLKQETLDKSQNVEDAFKRFLETWKLKICCLPDRFISFHHR